MVVLSHDIPTRWLVALGFHCTRKKWDARGPCPDIRNKLTRNLQAVPKVSLDGIIAPNPSDCVSNCEIVCVTEPPSKIQPALLGVCCGGKDLEIAFAIALTDGSMFP